MEIIIYGAGKWGKMLLDRCNAADGVNVIGFYDKRNIKEYYGLPVWDWRIGDKNTPVLISLRGLDHVVQIYSDLKSAGFEKIYWYCDDPYEDDFIKQFEDTAEWGDAVLNQAETHISDSCNLNCRGCAHFSPLFHSVNVNLQTVLTDVKMLAEKVSHILSFYLLGGEPFLNRNIGEYVKGIRHLLPKTRLEIVTNGLLIPRVSKETLAVIKENKVVVSISEYEPTHYHIDEILECLEAAGVKYRLRPYKSKQMFNKPIEVHPSGKYPLQCISNGCVNIYQGKICRCPTLMYAFKFNEVFDESLPTKGIMDLADCPSGKALLSKLKESVPLCQHCIKCEIPWSRCNPVPAKTDFAI